MNGNLSMLKNRLILNWINSYINTIGLGYLSATLRSERKLGRGRNTHWIDTRWWNYWFFFLFLFKRNCYRTSVQVLAVCCDQPRRHAGGRPLHGVHPPAPRPLVQVRRPPHHQGRHPRRPRQWRVTEKRPLTSLLSRSQHVGRRWRGCTSARGRLKMEHKLNHKCFLSF